MIFHTEGVTATGHVLLVTKNASSRESIRAVLSAERHVSALSDCSCLAEASAWMGKQHTPVIVIGPGFGSEEVLGFARVARSRSGGPELLVLAEDSDRPTLKDLFFNGIAGLVMMKSAKVHLGLALEALLAHKPYLCAEVQAAVLPSLLAMPSRYASRANGNGILTVRERQITERIARGLTSKQIGQELGLSFKTIEAHRASIMKKLAVSSAAELVNYASKNNLISVAA